MDLKDWTEINCILKNKIGPRYKIMYRHIIYKYNKSKVLIIMV